MLSLYSIPTMLSFLLSAVLILPAYCAALPSSPPFLQNRQSNITDYSIGKSGDIARQLEIGATRETFLYGADPAGTSVYYPAGVAGIVRTDADFAGLIVEVANHLVAVEADTAAATAAVALVSSTKRPVIISEIFHCRNNKTNMTNRMGD
jgi:hypothetical protein